MNMHSERLSARIERRAKYKGNFNRDYIKERLY